MFDALYIGRFQPFHNGHLHALKSILDQNGMVLIVIGSAEKSHTFENPLTVEERKKIISDILINRGWDSRCELKVLDDINDNDMWVDYLADSLPEFDKVYTGSDLVADLFNQSGRFDVLPVDFKDGVSATIIRNKIIKGENFADLVPPETYEYLMSIDIKKRLLVG